jgi:hypothetical protein
MEHIRKTIANAAGPIGIISAVMGFIGDVLQPLANFAPWVALLSFITAAVAFAGFYRLWRTPGKDAWEHPLLGVCVVASGFTIVFTLLSFVFAAGPERGYLADNIEPIAQLQAQLLNLQEDVTKIKETTQASATVVAAQATRVGAQSTVVAAQATQVGAIATTQAQGFADMQAALAALQAGKGQLINNPQTPQDWYANARLYQLRGDTANAIKSYEGYFAFGLEFVDPYLEYVALQKATEGIARTRQLIGDLVLKKPDSLTRPLIQITLLDAPTERLQRLIALAARAPQYGPVFDELGQEYDRALLATATGDLIKKQAEAYNTLFKLEEQQGFTRYYIDKTVADKRLENARKMAAAYATASTVIAQTDVQVYYYPNGVQFIVILTEQNVKQLLVSIDDPQPKTDTGKTTVGSLTVVNASVGPVQLSIGEHTFYMQYIDANGTPSKVLSKKIRVDPISVNFTQQPPDFSTGTIPGVFTVGIVGAEISELYKYEYSIDSDKLDQSMNGAAMGAINVKGLKQGEHTFYIRATAQNGKQTPIVKFAFTVK